jgi:hypothetical protein
VEEIFGHSKPVQTLLLAQDCRRPHAWIFCGPKGIGKCTVALSFAKQLLGTDSTNHPDLHLIRKEDVVWSQNPALQRRKQTNIPLDLLRERVIGGKTSDGKQHDSVAFKTPVLAKQKVFIIDEAELLTEDGQNALLKSVEEPPLNTTIIFISSREDLLLPTIRSRCQLLPFSPLDSESMSGWVAAHPLDVSQEHLSWAVDFSNGSPGLVCEAIDSRLPELVDGLSDFISLRCSDDYLHAHEKMYAYVESNVSRWAKENPNTSKDASNRRAMILLLRMLGGCARDRIRAGDSEVGANLAGVLVDIEKQLSTNISIKVFLESLAARWVNGCVGDAMFMSE